MKQEIKHTAKVLKSEYDRMRKQADADSGKAYELLNNAASLRIQMHQILKTFTMLAKNEPELKLSYLTETEEPHPIGLHTSIGDAMESVLKERGTLSRKEIIHVLRESGVKISQNRPEVVLANAVKQDRRKRFKVMPDKSIALAKAGK